MKKHHHNNEKYRPSCLHIKKEEKNSMTRNKCNKWHRMKTRASPNEWYTTMIECKKC